MRGQPSTPGPTASGGAPSLGSESQPPPPDGSVGPLLDPAAVAEAIASASTDGERYGAILEVMRAVAVGVYTPEGTAVIRGAERGPLDFFLYDVEVGLMAVAEGRGDTHTLADVSAFHESVGPTPRGTASGCAWRSPSSC